MVHFLEWNLFWYLFIHIFSKCLFPSDNTSLPEPSNDIKLRDACESYTFGITVASQKGRRVDISIRASCIATCVVTEGEVEERRVYTGFTLSVHPSVFLQTKSCPLCIFHNTGRIHLIFRDVMNQLQKVCRVSSIIRYELLPHCST